MASERTLTTRNRKKHLNLLEGWESLAITGYNEDKNDMGRQRILSLVRLCEWIGECGCGPWQL